MRVIASEASTRIAPQPVASVPLNDSKNDPAQNNDSGIEATLTRSLAPRQLANSPKREACEPAKSLTD